MSNLPLTFGRALRSLRMERGLSYKDIADACGVGKATVKAWERDEERPTGSEKPRLYSIVRSLRVYDMLLDSPVFDHIDPCFQGTVGEPRRAVETEIFPARPEPPALPEPAPAPTTWYEAIRAARVSEGLSLLELGEVIGVSDAAVGAWERNETNPVRENWQKLVDLFPALAHGPQPASQDIPKPIGPEGYTFPGRGGFPRATTVHPPVPPPVKPAPPPRPVTPPPAPEPEGALSVLEAGRRYGTALVVHGLAQHEVEAAREALAGAERALAAAESGVRAAKQDLDAAVAAEVEAAS